MKFDLIQLRRGKETIFMTDELAKVRDRMKTLRQSQRKGIKGEKVIYSIRPSESTDKFRKPPHKINLSGTPTHSIRRVPR